MMTPLMSSHFKIEFTVEEDVEDECCEESALCPTKRPSPSSLDNPNKRQKVRISFNQMCDGLDLL